MRKHVVHGRSGWRNDRQGEGLQVPRKSTAPTPSFGLDPKQTRAAKHTQQRYRVNLDSLNLTVDRLAGQRWCGLGPGTDTDIKRRGFAPGQHCSPQLFSQRQCSRALLRASPTNLSQNIGREPVLLQINYHAAHIPPPACVFACVCVPRCSWVITA